MSVYMLKLKEKKIFDIEKNLYIISPVILIDKDTKLEIHNYNSIIIKNFLINFNSIEELNDFLLDYEKFYIKNFKKEEN